MSNRFDKQAQVKAEAVSNGFNVYLILDGQWNLITHHRHNLSLFSLLEKGMDVEEMRHWRPEFRMKRSRKLVGSVRYLSRLADQIMEKKPMCSEPEDAWEDPLEGPWLEMFKKRQAA